MANHQIPDAAVVQCARGPSVSTVSAVKSLHENVRSVLGSNYETFLQGSYRNDTGVFDLNDVDIVAIRKGVVSSEFTDPAIGYPVEISWDSIFQDVQDKLEASYPYRGKTERGDKCITVNTHFHADVVPAVVIESADTDPIAIYSFREAEERKNFPRDHYKNNVSKQTRTSGAYKPTVRMFKRWTRNWFEATNIAPSFYVECLVHWVPDGEFSSDLAASFALVASYICQNVSSTTYMGSVAGDKDILVNHEWDWDRFSVFKSQLTRSAIDVLDALQASTESDAQRLWLKAFNE